MQILNSLAKVKRWQDSVNPRLIAKLEKARLSPARSYALKRQIGRLKDCGNFLTLREWLEHDGQVTLKNGNFCMNHLACRCCAMRRAAKVIAAYQAKIEHVLAGRPDLIPVMVTLSLRNTESLEEGSDRIRSAITRMMADRRKALSESCRNEYRNEWCKVQGSIKALEVTNKGKGWHPHFHVLCLISEYIDQKKLSREWKEYTGDSFVVDVRKLDSVESGLYEVLKYVTKFGELEPEQIADLHLVLGGKRLIDPQGLLRGVKVPETLADDDLTGAYREFWAHWNNRGWVLLDEILGCSENDFAGAKDEVLKEVV